MYRAVTWLALERGVSPEDSCGLGELARTHPIRLADSVSYGEVSRPVETAGTRLGPELYQSRVDNNVSNVSKHSTVRRGAVDQQREIAELAATVSGIVMIGRDIGTVVLPDAGLKVYLTASAEERARRRWREMGNADRKFSVNGAERNRSPRRYRFLPRRFAAAPRRRRLAVGQQRPEHRRNGGRHHAADYKIPPPQVEG